MTLKRFVINSELPLNPHALPLATQEALKELEHADEYPKYATVEEMIQAINADSSSH